jgi:hypothetical protein
MHIRLVTQSFEEDYANLNVLDALFFLGMIIETRLTTEDIPTLSVPEDLISSQFLEYIQVSPLISINIRKWLLLQLLVPLTTCDH